MFAKTMVPIIGSGDIGADLMMKVMRVNDISELGTFVGIILNRKK